jgi:hypothetical protein
MDTAQTILSEAGSTAKAATLLPWIVGGLVVLAAIYIFTKS